MMFKHTLMAAAIATLFASPAYAVSDAEWSALKDEISQMKTAYEARISELEARVTGSRGESGQRPANGAEPRLHRRPCRQPAPTASILTSR